MYLAKENENNHLLRDMDKMRHNNKELNEQLVAGNTELNDLRLLIGVDQQNQSMQKKIEHMNNDANMLK